MKFGILIETNEPEKAWNGVRFANASLKAGHEVRLSHERRRGNRVYCA